MMAKNRLILLAIAILIFIFILSFGESLSKSPKIKAWASADYRVGYQPFIDHLRGDLYGWSYSVMQKQLGRKDDKKSPGDYLDCPAFVIPKPLPFHPDSISSAKLNEYLKEVLRPEYFSVRISDFLSNYDNIWGDSTRDESFGRFMIDKQRMSVGGWYEKFTVATVYVSYDNIKDFLSLSEKIFILPKINADSVTITENDTLKFYEYIDRVNRIRLRGFPGVFSSKISHQDILKTTVIEYTKYYDPEFVP